MIKEIGNQVLSNYQSTGAKNGQQQAVSEGKSKVSSGSHGDSESYSVELSNEAKAYDLSKVMQIHEKGFHTVPSKEESEYYWAARKSDPALDSALYEKDKAAALTVVAQVQTILMKASMGQKLTPEEEEMVKSDPQLQHEIQSRKMKAEMFK